MALLNVRKDYPASPLAHDPATANRLVFLDLSVCPLTKRRLIEQFLEAAQHAMGHPLG